MHGEKEGDIVLIPYDIALETTEGVNFRGGGRPIVGLRSGHREAKVHIV